VTVVFAIEAFLVYLAIRSLEKTLPCWLSAPNHQSSIATCGESVVLFGHNSWVPAFVIILLLAVTLSAGIASFVAQLLRTNRALQQLGESLPAPANLIAAGAMCSVPVRLVKDPRCFACSAGFLSQHIVISTGMLERLDSHQLLAVLAHEDAHVKRHDPARATTVRTAASALFYLPLARHLADKALIASELGADAAAVSIAGQAALVGALMKVLDQLRPVLFSATEMASLDSLDSRIEALSIKTVPRVRPPFLTLTNSAVAVALLFVLGLWLPPPSQQTTFHPAHTVTPTTVPLREQPSNTGQPPNS
jgi:beta-lactamase regulating signal transducer with metallopeptidase domain